MYINSFNLYLCLPFLSTCTTPKVRKLVGGEPSSTGKSRRVIGPINDEIVGGKPSSTQGHLRCPLPYGLPAKSRRINDPSICDEMRQAIHKPLIVYKIILFFVYHKTAFVRRQWDQSRLSRQTNLTKLIRNTQM